MAKHTAAVCKVEGGMRVQQESSINETRREAGGVLVGEEDVVEGEARHER